MISNNINTLRMIWKSTQDLYDNFDLHPTQDATIEKMREEMQELVFALRYEDDAHALEEAADVIVTICGALAVRGLTVNQLIEALYKVAQKNARKNHDTHVVYNGTITRRAKLESE